MELRHLEYFVAVAEEAHFTRAAERLHLAQSGLSASIRALERELGAPLFVRSTRRVELTEAGRALLAEARRTLASVAAARNAVAAVQGLLRGTLCIGTEQCLGVVDIPAVLSRFRAVHPGVEIRLRQAGSSHLVEEVRAARLDLAFVAISGDPPAGVTLTSLTTEPMMLVCHPDHRLTANEAVDWSQLEDEVFVDFHADWGARQITDRAFAAAGLRRRVALEVNDVHSLLDFVQHDLGVALVPRPIAYKRKKNVRVLPLRATPPSWRVSVAVPTDGPTNNPASQALLGIVGDSLPLPVMTAPAPVPAAT
ncbi:LysR family transcriptional regulator [Actinoallomurus purpureus]|uniref:LysR family transcriptional regulator n=1 Tax=Actinoallomurus purpureus TaxID=478114 RepID=UPI002091EB9B|nr:LysR family transcriptional regulator [Actinoallomurus purpureus]MCO6005036.1 LysR family transcriptional regulator [Actinoallomurus purpureus]